MNGGVLRKRLYQSRATQLWGVLDEGGLVLHEAGLLLWEAQALVAALTVVGDDLAAAGEWLRARGIGWPAEARPGEELGWADYGWLVEQDHRGGQADDSAAGCVGPGDISPAARAWLGAGDGLRYGLYGAGGELVFSGRLLVVRGDAWRWRCRPVSDFAPAREAGLAIRYTKAPSLYPVLKEAVTA